MCISLKNDHLATEALGLFVFAAPAGGMFLLAVRACGTLIHCPASSQDALKKIPHLPRRSIHYIYHYPSDTVAKSGQPPAPFVRIEIRLQSVAFAVFSRQIKGGEVGVDSD